MNKFKKLKAVGMGADEWLDSYGTKMPKGKKDSGGVNTPVDMSDPRYRLVTSKEE